MSFVMLVSMFFDTLWNFSFIPPINPLTLLCTTIVTCTWDTSLCIRIHTSLSLVFTCIYLTCWIDRCSDRFTWLSLNFSLQRWSDYFWDCFSLMSSLFVPSTSSSFMYTCMHVYMYSCCNSKQLITCCAKCKCVTPNQSLILHDHDYGNTSTQWWQHVRTYFMQF